jgi:hypothetical protein
MSVQDVVDRVVEMLSRAESLFASPADAATSNAVDALTGAAEASRIIAARTEALGGALASAHRGLLRTVARRIEQAAGTDAQLAEHIARAGQVHAEGGSRATDLRLGAQEIQSQLGPWSEVPASELAGLLALRGRVADMQRLLADHTSEAARATEEVLGLGYRQ